MASESLQIPADPISCTPQGAESRVKFRVRFRKAGDLRFVSHHDLMHIFERAFRRAELKVPVTQGFNPRPRMWFALSLALGIAGLNEILELELADALPADELERRLVRHAPPGIAILSVRPIDVRTSAHVRRAWYRASVPITPDEDPASISERCASFLSLAEYWIERARPRPRRINVRPFVSELRAAADAIVMALWITSNGAARPAEILEALGLHTLLDSGALIERTDLEIIDELPPDERGVPVLENVTEETSANDGDSAGETPLSSRPTAIFSGPMSFDS